MKIQDKATLSAALIAAAIVFATLTLVFSSLNGVISSILFTHIFLIITLILVLIGLYLLFPSNYFKGGYRNILSLLPICRAKIASASAICARCTGFPIGVVVSAFLSALVFYFEVWANQLMSIEFWILMTLALLLNSPTAIHGYLRRLKTPTRFDGPLPRFLMGVLSGLGFFLAFLAYLKLLGFGFSLWYVN